MKVIRWLGKNISAFILAFILAIAVWISAVTATDPNQERVFIIPIEPWARKQILKSHQKSRSECS